jgi:hypothetical protein
MNDLIVAKVDQARLLLADARDATDAKRVADMAHAAEVYARRQKLSGEAMQYAHSIKVDALTLMGEFLKAGPTNKGAKGSKVTGSLQEPVRDDTPTLTDIGLSKKESAIAKALAILKKEDPELHEKVRDGSLTIGSAWSVVKRRKAAQKKEELIAELRIEAESDFQIYRIDQADCLEWFAAQPEDSIDLVFGSPPYEDARLYLEAGSDPGIARNTEEWVAWMVEVYRAARRCCTGLVAFVVEGRTKNYRWSAAPALLMAALHREGFHLRKPPIYYRVGIPGSGGPDWLRNDYEFIIGTTRGGELPWSANTAMGSPCVYEPGGDPSHRLRDGSRVNSDGAEVGYASMDERNNVGPHRARQQAGRVYQPPEIANPGNVIRCTVGGGNMGDPLSHENEAPFPEDLAEFFVRSFCPPGGVVCDPFCGSGTTGALAVRHRRRFVGCDLRASQVDLARRRIGRVQRQLPVIGE